MGIRELSLRDSELEVTRAVTVARDRWETATKNVVLARVEVEQAEEDLRVARLRNKWCLGIDTVEDLDDEELCQKWEHGRRLLRKSLHNYQEATYLQGLGLTIYGQKPFGRILPN